MSAVPLLSGSFESMLARSGSTGVGAHADTEADRRSPPLTPPKEPDPSNNKHRPTSSAGQVPRGQPAWWDFPAKLAILAGLLALIAYAILSGQVVSTGRRFFAPGLHTTFWYGMTAYAAIMYIALVWRIVLWMRYKPMPSVSDAELPRVSVIIPAFNEGALVRQSILSVAHNDYPAEKVQIIVVDDGSTDDTWKHIVAAVRELESSCNIQAFRQPRNMGKREALYAGFQRADGDVFVTMDSDSIFACDALRHGVTPLVRNPRIGCVAGCVEVLNPHDSIWTRFLRCTFSLSFKFVRAYQNQLGGVFCTPGALSVYRASVVRKVAKEWLDQKFLGRACMTGEDRAMTNLFLREGWLTAYQENARVWAEMPTTYRGTTKMLLRWARSNIRETIVLQRFLFKPFRSEHLTAFRINMLLVLSTLIVPYLLVFNSLALVLMHPDYFARHLSLVAVFGLTQAAIYYRRERDSNWLWLMLYEMFWVFGFVWIMPYAALTLKNTGWLTRGQQRPSPLPAPAVTASMPAPAAVAATVAATVATAVAGVGPASGSVHAAPAPRTAITNSSSNT